MLTNRPAMKFLLPFVIGILIGTECPLPLWLVESLLGIFLFCTLLSLPRTSNRSGILNSLSVFGLILCFGMFRIAVDGRIHSDDNVAGFVSPKAEVTLLGIISEYPKSNGQSIQFVVDAESLAIRGRWFKTSGGVITSVRINGSRPGFLDSISYGRIITLAGQLVALGGERNPGEPDLRQYYHVNNVYARFLHRNGAPVLLGSVRKNFLSALVYPVRRSIAYRFERFVRGEEAAFLKGLIIGDRSEIRPDLKDAFVNAGVMHIIAVAGLHVGMIGYILLSVFTALRFPRRIRLLLLAVCLFFFIFLSGSAEPVIRAVTMAIIFIGGTFLERRIDVYNSLALAGIVLLLLDARNLFQAGFQLSFSAVFFLIYLYPRCKALTGYLPEVMRKNPLVRFTTELVSVSLSAAIGTLPFTSLYFGKVSLIGLAANIVVVPVTGVVLALGLTTVVISYLSAWIGAVYAASTKLLAHVLLQSISFFGNLSFAYIDSHFSLWSSLAFYGVVIVIANIRNKALVRRFVILFMVAANMLLYRELVSGDSGNRNLRVTFLDVGQGDAVFIEFPNGKNLLMDAGPRTPNVDAGNRFVGPFLKSQGVHRLNAIVLSHPDGDHIGGAPYLLRHFLVDRIIDCGTFSRSGLSQECLHLADSLHIRPTDAIAGSVVGGYDNARLYVMNPQSVLAPADTTVRLSFNNQSLVVKLLYGRTSLLLTGDAEEPAEQRMIESYGGFVASDVLKAGHHGSRTSSSPEFLAAVRPELAIISVGQNNTFGHPSREVLERLENIHCEYLRTDELGAVVLESDGTRWHVVHWH
ncbi:MAG: DNA internalization-related competence protein ComEC/Rec2 [Bacteroidota bacterium]